MKGACQTAVIRALRQWHCNALYNTHADTPCTCMGDELTVQGTQCEQEGRWPITVQYFSVGLLTTLFLSDVLSEDLHALLRSIFLYITAVSRPIFLKPTLYSIVNNTLYQV